MSNYVFQLFKIGQYNQFDSLVVFFLDYIYCDFPVFLQQLPSFPAHDDRTMRDACSGGRGDGRRPAVLRCPLGARFIFRSRIETSVFVRSLRTLIRLLGTVDVFMNVLGNTLARCVNLTII